MPLWHVYHPPGAYTEQDKKDFAKDITAFYTNVGLPKFYVLSFFHEVPSKSYFVGEEASSDMVRVCIEHTARNVADVKRRRWMVETIAKIINPYTIDRGLHYEFNIDETPMDLWMVDGLWPPEWGSEGEKLWARENKAVPFAIEV
ncbi:tautomerase family protein [Rhodococcus sp. NPDC057014]|uniref:tautomerase family protein n=1 Tax=Rhodococcus sp. NPDC057014 TaxID=3346000 RepID=UPI0036261F5C